MPPAAYVTLASGAVHGYSRFDCNGKRKAIRLPSLLNRIFEGNAFRVVFLDPSIGRFFAGEHLNIINVAREASVLM